MDFGLWDFVGCSCSQFLNYIGRYKYTFLQIPTIDLLSFRFRPDLVRFTQRRRSNLESHFHGRTYFRVQYVSVLQKNDSVRINCLHVCVSPQTL